MSMAPLLSICIPTYRRGHYLARDIKRALLMTSRNDFEFVVVDNASPDGSFDALATIHDSRLRCFKNTENIGSFENYVRVLEESHGTYALILMDKDSILFEHIDEALDSLQKLNVACGFFCPNHPKSLPRRKTTVTNTKNILCQYGLCYAHPSGHFFRTEYLRTYGLADKLRKLPKATRPFNTDFLVDLFACHGAYVRLYQPFVHLNEPPFEGLSQTVTYSEPKTAYFMPETRWIVMQDFLRLLRELNLSIWSRFLISIRQTCILFAFSTSSYIDILLRDNLCDWYGLSHDFRIRESHSPLIRAFYHRIILENPLPFLERLGILAGGVICLPFVLRFTLKRKTYNR